MIIWIFIIIPSITSAIIASFTNESSIERPQFTVEPPNLAEFSNSTGYELDCKANGKPQPIINWFLMDGSLVSNVQRLRYISPNGNLVFPPFKAEDYRQDVHSVVYRCSATNSVGTIVSRDVTVRGVVLQQYEVYVYDVYVIKNNTAVFRCHVPALLMEYVRVTSWIMNESFVINLTDIKSDFTGSKYFLTSTGELYVRNASTDDMKKTFRCSTAHELTGQLRLSSSSGRLIVTDPRMSVLPRITDQRSEMSGTAGEAIFIRCVAEGHPPPTTEWYIKEGREKLSNIPNNKKYHILAEGLLIRSLTRDDSGVYSCVVTNVIGTEKAETTLSVIEPLTASVTPNLLKSDVSSSLKVTCDIKGYPISSVYWMKDGRLANSLEYVTSTGSTLIIDSIRSFHKGIWQCFVKNSFMMAHGSFELILGDAPPEFVSLFEDKILKFGSQLSLICSATGTPTPEIRWTLDGISITNVKGLKMENGTVISWLNISSVRTEDSGVYMCKAFNKAGSIQFSKRINVYGKLSARQRPQISAISGEDSFIDCPVVGYPIDNIMWQKGGVLLPVDIQQEIFMNGTLLIRKVQRSSDAGEYFCIAGNKLGDSVTSSVKVAVLVPPKIIPFGFPEDVAREGMRVSIACIISEGDLPLTIKWVKDGESLHSNLGISVREIDMYSSISVIPSIRPQHNGNYTCIVSNNAASASHTATLAVTVPPRWQIVPQNTTVKVGESIIIHCQADGFPLPSIEWMKVEGKTPSGMKYKLSSGKDVALLSNFSLKIFKALPEHQGFYFCIADNGVGKGLSKAVFVKVQAPVYFQLSSQDVAVKIGTSADLNCEAFGDTPISFIWSHKNRILNIDRHHRLQMKIINDNHSVSLTSVLTLNTVLKNDSGEFTCKANNLYGGATTKFNLIVKETPEIPEVLVIKNLGDRSVELSWNVPFDGNSEIIQFLLQYKRKQDSWQARSTVLEIDRTSTSRIVKGLQPATVYEFRVAAENAIGRSGYSNVVTVALGEEAPEGPPLKVEVEAIDPDVLRISWKPPKKNLWNGAIRGYYVGYKVVDSPEGYTFTMLEVPEDYTEDLIYQITDLSRYTQYSIIIQAYNNGGKGPSSEEIIAMTSEDVPRLPPQEVRCSPLSSHSIYVVWEPPPPDEVNGILRGYKVYYKLAEELYDGSLRSNISQFPRQTLYKLDVNRNYSIQVSSFTRIGESPRSEPVFCKTHEDVPGPPDAIKALPSSFDSVLVTWRPPNKPNGIIIKFNVYYKLHEGGHEDSIGYTFSGDDSNKKDVSYGVSVHNLDPAFTYFEVKRLQKNRRYEFWVTAVSSIGEGPSSTVVIQSPAVSYVPAKSASFDQEIFMPWKKDLLLACRAVGIPTPKRIWKKGYHTVHDSERMKIHSDGTLLIKKTDDMDSGNYTCNIENQFGQDEVQYKVIIQVPPPVPVLNIASKSLTSINLQWKIDGDGGDPIRGFILYYKREDGQWHKQDLPSNVLTYILNNLSCGATYKIYLTAYNGVGVGLPCDVETVTTQGEAFYQVAKEALIREGATFVTVHLDVWPDTGCPIQYFTADYKRRNAAEWISIPTNYRPSNKKLVISGLNPGTFYNLRLTAHTSGEPQIAIYNFVTLLQNGGTIPPNVLQKEEKVVYFYLDPWIFIPLVALIITIIVASIVVCMFMKRRSNNRDTAIGVVPANWPSNDGTLNRSRLELGVSVESFVHLQRGSGNTLGKSSTLRRNREDPSPYASVQISSYPTNPDMMMQLTEKRPIAPPIPPCPEALPSSRDKKWISEEDIFGNERSDLGFHNNWDQGYSSADGENIYATANRPPFGSLPNTNESHLIPSLSNLPTEETTFVFQTKPNESGIHPGIRDQSNAGRLRDVVTPENAWLLDDRYPNPHKEDIY